MLISNLSAEMHVLKNSLPVKFKFENLKNQLTKVRFQNSNVYKLIQINKFIVGTLNALRFIKLKNICIC